MRSLPTLNPRIRGWSDPSDSASRQRHRSATADLSCRQGSGSISGNGSVCTVLESDHDPSLTVAVPCLPADSPLKKRTHEHPRRDLSSPPRFRGCSPQPPAIANPVEACCSVTPSSPGRSGTSWASARSCLAPPDARFQSRRQRTDDGVRYGGGRRRRRFNLVGAPRPGTYCSRSPTKGNAERSDLIAMTCRGRYSAIVIATTSTVSATAARVAIAEALVKPPAS